MKALQKYVKYKCQIIIPMLFIFFFSLINAFAYILNFFFFSFGLIIFQNKFLIKKIFF
ncbi:hypothetical protein NBO_6g0067 [Nosema bombycis CQ1]|uniref:Uncharacterized protein n=1 Tax=Nosema bombycis (strain CQ1 / CVCC 102059) TaxID=578461 RepID=R0KWQ6_NOSB1|nr:hypothetical protein NBO_6g0067 [Nosema bombycis CQ1]|eukprot:EOB15316.1 hypothetical protein NBO_6g0067 [Nosema bombycis CQ1]